MDIGITRRRFWDAPNREYRDKPIQLDVTQTDPQALVPFRRGSTDRDESAALPPRRASVNTTLVRDMCPSMNEATRFATLAVESIGRLGVEVWRLGTILWHIHGFTTHL